MKIYNQHNFIDHFIGAIPELNKDWIEFNEEWIEEERIPNYIFLGDLADHIVDYRDELNLTELFQRVENVLWDGDHYSFEATTVGLLEDIQNRLLHEKLPLSVFDEYMLPKTKRMWQRVIDFWDKGIIIRDD